MTQRVDPVDAVIGTTCPKCNGFSKKMTCDCEGYCGSRRCRFVYNLTFRVIGYYYAKVKSGEKNFELREDTPFWAARAGKAQKHLVLGGGPVIGIFFCSASRIVRRRVWSVFHHDTVADAVGGAIEKEIRAMLNFGKKPVWKFNLGEEVA